MKTFFSEYAYPRKEIKYLRGCSQRNGSAKTALMFKTSWRDLNPGRSEAVLLSEMQLLYAQDAMLSGAGCDYFIETPELVDLLCGMVNEFSADVLTVFHEHRETSFVIHPPSPKPAVLVSVVSYESHTQAVVAESGKNSPLSILGGASFKSKSAVKPETWGMRLAIGLALYVRFFPDAMRDQLPEIAKQPAHYKGRKCVSVGLHESLIDRSGPKPHIRQAHFRFLSSKRFKQKRGQCILVKGSFVRGKIKIIVEVEGEGRL